MKDGSLLGLHSSIWQRWSDERGAGQGACDFKAVTIPVLISPGEENHLTSVCVLTSASVPVNSWKPKDDLSTFKVQ